MVRLETARAANDRLVSKHPLVAVFVGATTGIGEYSLRCLAETASKATQGRGLRIYLVGRNATAADKILGDCRKLCPEGEFQFVKGGNLALMQDVDAACEDIEKRESAKPGARVDTLVQSQAVLKLEGPREETKEGLDSSMSLLYYSRVRFITKLLPLLRASKFPPGARCISIYAGGLENKKQFYPADFSLRQPEHFSFAKVRSQTVYMKTLLFEKLAQENEGKLACVHMYPGLVITPNFYADSHPWWFKLVWVCVAPLAKIYATSAEEIGQRVLYLATERYPAQSLGADRKDVASSSNGVLGGGAYSVKADGDTNDLSAAYAGFDKEDMREKVWDHTMQVFRNAENTK
ncbi:uncharacterized protein LTR77_001464 [Saxophila tyrrhenica]|uniref:Uncharacterized protein n=1 Tax=Saxophila tyrrhenica TaxID=1690608 RepID=A0AAV9PNS3_9PEZI|nr:hypothetical protein LTR77_001464 [Saxophila tyrrhenica]